MRAPWPVFIALFGCGRVAATNHDAAVDTPTVQMDAPVDATHAVQHLYVGNDKPAGGISQYTLPLTVAATANFTFPLANAVDMISDAAGNLVAADNAGHVFLFAKPLSAASTPTATFNNAGSTANGQLVITPDGALIAATQGTSLNVFTPPFTNATVSTSKITAAALSSGIGAALDSSANLYVGNTPTGGGSDLVVFAPPYTDSVNTPLVTGTLYRKITISTTQLFVTSVANAPGRVDVYTLPITQSSTPAFSIVNGVNTPETVALDSEGHLYVGNLNDATIAVYSPPFSAGSTPDLTLPIGNPATTAIFGISIGP